MVHLHRYFCGSAFKNIVLHVYCLEFYFDNKAPTFALIYIECLLHLTPILTCSFSNRLVVYRTLLYELLSTLLEDYGQINDYF